MLDKIKIVSLNVRGFRDEKKRKETFNFLRKNKFDILCIQESHSEVADEKLWTAQCGCQAFYSHGCKDSQGVVTYVNKSIKAELCYSDCEGRYVIIQVTKDEETFLVINVYGPNNDNPEFFKDLCINIGKLDSMNLVLIGDYNLVMDPSIDRIGGKRYSPKAFEIIKCFIEEYELVDIWRVQNPDIKRYSWTRKKTHSNEILGCRIDFALMSPGMANNTVNSDYNCGYRTDHSMVVVEIQVNKNPRGPGYWKFNNLLLHDLRFVEKSNQIIADAQKYQDSKPDVIWQCCKNDLITWAKKFGIEKAKDRKQKFENLKNRLEKHMQQQDSTGKVDNANEIESLKGEIEKYIELQTQSAMFRSRARYIKSYERSSKFFFSLEKSKYNQKTMNRIVNGQTVITDPNEILNEQHKFYADLYRANPDSQFRLTSKGKTLQPEDYSLCEKPISYEEICSAVKSMKRERTPGIDGLSAEYYQFFFSKMGMMYYNAIMYAKEIGTLHLSATRGIITLIPKRNKNPCELKGWRPLTMLSMCYKILAKAVALRLKTVFPYLINENQTGFMQDRCISETIRVTIDIARYGKKLDGYLMLLDFEKCFDRIEYGAIRGSLEYLGFGKEFVSWVNLLLNNFQSATSNNGYFSNYFPVTRSCHQGCPVAPLLFLACGEVLSREIHQNSNISGIQIQTLERILSQFADDTQLFLRNRKSVEAVIRTLSDIEANTGLKINYDKSAIYCIGTAKPFKCSKPLVWDPGGCEILGIDISDSSHSNYVKIIEKSRAVLNSWCNRQLTLSGKVLTINTLISSLFVYHMQIEEDPSEGIYKEFNQILHKFLWGTKRAKIPMKLLQWQ